ncbi:MAG: hypothetical protein EHM72_08725 [Calditrichaeota bacterium]|nr:MAG: hypothetical protein EHM72_08725 [Calditrichota bacterium]
MKNLIRLSACYCISILWFYGCSAPKIPSTAAEPTAREARIDPDYSGVVIPPNIAPLNFRINEPGKSFLVSLHGENGSSIRIESHDGKICFPPMKWKTLLHANRGQSLHVDIWVRDSHNKWRQFRTITNRIAEEEIDSHMVYRLINPAFQYWNKMGIYQRDLESFEQKPIMTNVMTDGNCMNCHNFCLNNPLNMIFHMRTGAASGTYLSVNGQWSKVNLKTEFNKGGAYPSWHPNAKMLAFSVNDLTMFYHFLGESRDVLDRNSDLVVYNIEKNMITASPLIADVERMETFPAWSADGRHLYFCAADNLDSYVDPITQDLRWNEIRYDLMRVAYDVERDEWSDLETVIPASKLGLSVIIPRPSPDGKYVLFCMSTYGSFPIYHQQSDLYMLDVASGNYWPLAINSEETDSFHSWSSNSRWFVFTSKRYDTLLGRPYFAYVDDKGVIYKPFILPQKDPDFYKNFIINYNVPELTMGQVPQRLQKILKIAYGPQITQATLDPRIKPRKSREQQEPEAMYKQARPQR